MAVKNRVLEVRRLGPLSYEDGLTLQDDLVSRRREGAIPDQLLLLEHPHVITLGSSGSRANVLATDEQLTKMGIGLFETGRGGDVTYHGPGQLVGYPIIDLKPDRRDLHRYLRDLEEVLIRALAVFDVRGERVDGLTGVWTGEGKIAAIGIRVSSGWITSHGFALNVGPDLRYYGTIVPCGIRDREVTSLADRLRRPVTVAEVVPAVVGAFEDVFSASAVFPGVPSGSLDNKSVTVDTPSLDAFFGERRRAKELGETGSDAKKNLF